MIDAYAELERAALNAFNGVRDPRAAEEACRWMDRMREELREKTGDLDIALELIREAREE